MKRDGKKIDSLKEVISKGALYFRWPMCCGFVSFCVKTSALFHVSEKSFVLESLILMRPFETCEGVKCALICFLLVKVLPPTQLRLCYFCFLFSTKSDEK